MTAEEILNHGEDKIKELTAGVDMMRFTLAIEEELHSLPFPEISIYINGNKVSGEPGLCIDQLWAGSEERELLTFVEKKIEERKKAAKLILMKAGVGVSTEEDPEEPPVTIAEADPEPEVAPAQPEKTDKVSSAVIIPDNILKDEYFKRGKTVKQIAEDYNVGVHGLYKRIEKMKQQKEATAKECASSKR